MPLQTLPCRAFQRGFALGARLLPWRTPTVLSGAGSLLKLPDVFSREGASRPLVVASRRQCADERFLALRAALEGKRPAPPSPAHPELLPAATEKDVFLLSPDAGHGPILRADASLEDALTDAQSEPEPTVALALGSWDELDALVDCQFQLEKPLCLVCDDAELLEAALRLYQGRALYEGSLPEATLLPLCEKYGLLI